MRRLIFPGLLSVLALLALVQVAVAAWKAPQVRAVPVAIDLDSPARSASLSASRLASPSPSAGPARAPVRLVSRTQRRLDEAAVFCRAQSTASRTCRPTRTAPDRPPSLGGIGCVCE